MPISSHIRRNWGTKEGIGKETELFMSKSLLGSLVSGLSGYVCVPALLHRSSQLVLTIPLWGWWHHSDFKDENWSAEKGKDWLSFTRWWNHGSHSGVDDPQVPALSFHPVFPWVEQLWKRYICSSEILSQIAVIHERSFRLEKLLVKSLEIWNRLTQSLK